MAAARPDRDEEELLRQWAFIDSVVERQARLLRAGVEDPEEDDPVVAVIAMDQDSQLAELQRRNQELTSDVTQLRHQLHEQQQRQRQVEARERGVFTALRSAHEELQTLREDLEQRTREIADLRTLQERPVESKSGRRWWRR